MKKLIAVLTLFLLTITGSCITIKKIDNTKFDTTEFKQINQLFRAASSAPSDSTTALHTPTQVLEHLKFRFPDNQNWFSLYDKSVADVYGGEPMDQNSKLKEIQDAIEASGTKSDYGGCGPLAMISQFDYLARYAGYTSLNRDVNNLEFVTTLAYHVLFNTYTTELSTGTVTYPTDFLAGANEVLKIAGLEEQIKVRAVIYLPYSSTAYAIKKSIDKGMPAVLWTLDGAGDFKNHYMNVYGYTDWYSTDKNGDLTSHTIFKLRMNWGEKVDYYMDSDVLKATCGLVLFEEINDNILIKKSDYEYEGQYFFYEKSKNIAIKTPKNKPFTFATKRLRTGFIENEQLVMSPRRANAGTAYIEYTSSKPIIGLNVDLAFWSSNENLSFTNSTAKLQYKDSNGIWCTAINILMDIDLSKFRNYPDCFSYYFDEPIYEFRFYSTSVATGDKNSGRICIGNINSYIDSSINI